MTFRHYTICQDSQGATVEVWRGTDEVACLAFDTRQHCFVELHVAIGSGDRARDAASFQDLVQLATPLRHRHLLGVIEGGEDEGSNYHITPFLDGERLDSWLARSHPLPPWLALLVIRQLVEGLTALAGQPRLLAGVEVFHAGLTLTGPHGDDLVVKICDLGLSGPRPAATDPQLIEARAIHETGRLLHYMLTGALTEFTAPVPAGRNLPAELIFLLNTILQPGQPHHPRTLAQLRTLTDRCLHDLSADLTSQPELLPAQYRPRLPLTAHLPGGAATAELLSNDFTLDTRAPDAADPYRHRGTERATRRPVNVQLFPPAGLLPSGFVLPALEKAWHTLAGQRDPHLLIPLAFHPDGPGPLMVEERTGKYTLDSLRRLRAPLDPAEVHLVLTKIDEAARAAAARQLPVHWRCPRLLPIQFTGPGGEEALPAPAQLARLSLTDWPAFTIKVRTWPLTLDFTQPDRFQPERLLPRDPALSGESPAVHHHLPTTLPSARDFALMALWLLGGSAQLKENLKPLVYAAISARGPALGSAREFLDRFLTAAAVRATAAPVVLPKSKSKTKSRDKTGRMPSPALIPAARNAPVPAGPDLPADALPEAPHGGIFSNLPPADPDPEAESDQPSLGFAEALFGAAPEADRDDRPSGFLPPQALWPAAPEPAAFHGGPDAPDYYDPDAPPEGVPLGFMEAAGQSGGYDQPSRYHDPSGRSAGSSRWMLLLIVLLIAAALAALMAQLSGQAVWLK